MTSTFTFDPAVPLDPHDPVFRTRGIAFPDWVTHFRPHQWEAIVQAYESFARGNKFVFIDAPTGCLAADTEIVARRGGSARRYPIAEVVEKFNGGGTGRRWNLDTPTFVQRLRMSPKHGPVIMGVELARAVHNGVKDTYRLTTSAGRSIVATPDHPFMLDGGGLTAMGQLVAGDGVLVDIGKGHGNREAKQWYRVAQGLVNHPLRGEWPYRQPLHRLVAEAGINNLRLDWYLAVLRDPQALVAGLTFLSPMDAVHHLDHDAQNNHPSNLHVVAHREHHRLHGVDGAWAHPANRVGVEWVETVEHVGMQDVFDLTVVDEPHDYVANGFVVGNTGKTLIGETVRRLVGADRSLYVCSTKSLQDQFLSDYPYAKVLKGKSNYPTLDHPSRFHDRFDPLTAEDCEHIREFLPACDRCNPDDISDTEVQHCLHCHPVSQSPYVVARYEAMEAEVAVLNTAYLLAEANNIGNFSKRKFVIADECDTLESVLLGYVGVEIGPWWAKRLGIEPPQRKTGEAKTGQSWGEWVQREALPKVDQALANPTGLKNRQKNALKRMQGDLRRLMGDLYDRERSENWVYMDEGKKMVFKPIRVNEWAEQALWQHSDKWLLMSATLIDPSEQVESLGIPDHEWDIVTVEGGFPKHRRPIVVKPVADMTKKSIDADPSIPGKMAMEVAKIVRAHPDDRILVHTVSYHLTQVMLDKVGIVCQDRPMLSYASSNDREQVLREFKETERAVVFAPSFDRGIDLAGDLCRVQVVCKIPFASLGDKQIQKRVYGPGGNLWYSVSTIRTLVQMTGRGMRSKDDYCVTYILDKQFVSNIWSKSKRFLPKWWSEALVWDGKVPKQYWDLAAETPAIK